MLDADQNEPLGACRRACCFGCPRSGGRGGGSSLLAAAGKEAAHEVTTLICQHPPPHLHVGVEGVRPARLRRCCGCCPCRAIVGCITRTASAARTAGAAATATAVCLPLGQHRDPAAIGSQQSVAGPIHHSAHPRLRGRQRVGRGRGRRWGRWVRQHHTVAIITACSSSNPLLLPCSHPPPSRSPGAGRQRTWGRAPE